VDNVCECEVLITFLRNYYQITHPAHWTLTKYSCFKKRMKVMHRRHDK